MDTGKLVGMKPVESLQEAVITLEFVRKHLVDSGHQAFASEVSRVTLFLTKHSDTHEKYEQMTKK